MIEGGTIKLLFRRMNMYIARWRRRHGKRTDANNDKVTLMKQEERAITLMPRPEVPKGQAGSKRWEGRETARESPRSLFRPRTKHLSGQFRETKFIPKRRFSLDLHVGRS